MVIGQLINKITKSKPLEIWLGWVLFNLSIGFSIAIAKSSNLSFSQGDKIIKLGHVTENLEKETDNLLAICEGFGNGGVPSQLKEKLINNAKEGIKETNEEIKQIIEGNEE